MSLLVAVLVAAMCFGQKPDMKVQSSGFQELDEWTEVWKEGQQTFFGYPANQNSALREFYEWYLGSGMYGVNLNNAGDPMNGQPWKMSSSTFEREVIEYFAPLYGFEKDKVWGIVTHSGTDGNNHGIYFGANYLYNKTGKMPVVYVSDEAHYSTLFEYASVRFAESGSETYQERRDGSHDSRGVGESFGHDSSGVDGLCDGFDFQGRDR